MSAFAIGKGADAIRVRRLISRFSLSMVLAQADAPPVFHRKSNVGQCLSHAIAHAFDSLLKPHLLQCQHDGLGLLHASVEGFLGVNDLEHGGHLPALGFRHLHHDVSIKVHRAALVCCIWEHLGNSSGLVTGEQPHTEKPAALQPREELAPALGRLREPLSGADDLVVAVVDVDGRNDRDVLERSSLASLQIDAVDEET